MPTWYDAARFCSSLRLGGYSDWRLPELDELQGIRDPTQRYDTKGGIKRCAANDYASDGSDEVWGLNPHTGRSSGHIPKDRSVNLTSVRAPLRKVTCLTWSCDHSTLYAAAKASRTFDERLHWFTDSSGPTGRAEQLKRIGIMVAAHILESLTGDGQTVSYTAWPAAHL